MLHLINAGLHDEYNIIVLQEPYLDSLGNMQASHKWRVILYTPPRMQVDATPITGFY